MSTITSCFFSGAVGMSYPQRVRRRFLGAGLAAAAIFAASAALALKSAAAADAPYPTKPIRVVVPFAAGSATDIMMRQLGPRMSDALGQQLIIDNRPGAVGVIGSEVVMRTPPDGYTLVMSAVSSHSIAPAVRANLPYDVLRDFTPIGRACTSANFIVVHPSVPARSLKQLIAFSKTVAGGVSFSSGGTGSSNHLAGEMLRIRTGANFVHVPYSSVSQALIDTIGGQIPMMVYTVAVLPYVRQGRLRALAVTSEQRSKQAPEVPTVIEQGVPGMVANSWFGLFGPARLPDPIRDRLYAVLRDALLAPEVSSKLIEVGLEPSPLSPAEFRAFIERDIAMWKDVVKKSGVKID